jgi:hypothetical protein
LGEKLKKFKARVYVALIPLVFTPLITACSASSTNGDLLEEVAILVQPKKAEDFLSWRVLKYEKDDEASFISVGNITAKIEVTNTSLETLQGFATTLTINDSSGEEILTRTFNTEKPLAPGESRNLGYFGDSKLPLIASFEKMQPLIDTVSLQEETKLIFEIRKVALEDGSILEFRN